MDEARWITGRVAAQLDAGTLKAVDILQYIGYEDEDADEKTLITERRIID
jgi:hypothetical protein